jgi:hypothetical protein
MTNDPRFIFLFRELKKKRKKVTTSHAKTFEKLFWVFLLLNFPHASNNGEQTHVAYKLRHTFWPSAGHSTAQFVGRLIQIIKIKKKGGRRFRL